MKVLSLFSGVGGFDLGLENAGMETVFQCEWDKHATKILERHWPDVPRWTDVSTLTGAYVLQHAPVIDVVAWGSPCQDLSVAGKRAGLSGQRSGLFHEGIRIIKEIRELTNGKYPRISVWENVAGALSSGAGADFGQVLYEMDEAGACFSEWRMLDAQYFGVPQRRRRVFVVSVFDSATAERCPNPLLPVSEGVQWHPSQGRTTRQTVAGTLEQSLASSSQWAAGSNEHDVLRQSISSKWSKGSSGPSGDEYINMVVGSLAARDYKGVGNQYVNEGKLVVEPFVKAKRAQSTSDDETWVEGDINPTINQFDQGDVRATTAIVMCQREGKPGGGKGPLFSEDKSLTLAAAGNDQNLFVEQPIVFENSYRDSARIAEDGITQTLSAKMGTGGGNTPMVAFATNQRAEVRELGDKAVALSAEPGTNQQTYVAIGIQGNVIGRQDHNGPAGKGHTEEGDPMFTLNTTDRHAVATSGPAIVFSHTQGLSPQPSETASPTLRTEGAGMAVAFTTEQTPKYNTDQTLTLTSQSPTGGEQPQAVMEPTMSVRRLTPLECERLMGWPDDWTAGQADTHRYKQCGNGVASPVAQWIGEQIINL